MRVNIMHSYLIVYFTIIVKISILLSEYVISISGYSKARNTEASDILRINLFNADGRVRAREKSYPNYRAVRFGYYFDADSISTRHFASLNYATEPRKNTRRE